MNWPAIGVGTMFCGSGAIAHFRQASPRQEQMLALAGLCFLILGALMTD